MKLKRFDYSGAPGYFRGFYFTIKIDFIIKYILKEKTLDLLKKANILNLLI